MSTSLSEECNGLKTKYDSCFNSWYTEKYLKGSTSNDCDPLFQDYKACIWKTIKTKKIDVLIEEATKQTDSENQ